MLKVFSIECLFPGSNIVYLNALLMSIIPFFLFFFTILFWLAISRFRKVQLLKNLNKLVTSLVIIIFTIQPTIINCLISIISCREIDNGKFYLVSFLNEECGTSQNNLWRNFLFYPAFFFYAIALPLMPFCYIIFYRKNLYVLDRFKKVGFLFNGYMKKKFYWEFVFFYRKIVVIIIINYFTMNNPTKALLILMILLISLWLQALENPYISDDLNSIDFKATFVAFLTIFGGLLAWLSDTNESQMLMSIMIFLTNVLFVYHWFRRFLIQTLPWYLHSRYLSCIHKYLLKLQPEYDTLLAQQKNNGIMGISNSESSKLDNIPKKSSFFFSFKNAFSNLIEEPSKSPSFMSKKKLKDPPDFTFKTFGDFQEKLNQIKSKNMLEVELVTSARSNQSTKILSKTKSNNSARLKSTQKLLSLSNIEEEKVDHREEITELRELIHLQNKEIELLNKKIDKMRGKLQKLRNSKVFSKNELKEIFGKKERKAIDETKDLRSQPREFNFNQKTNYFETFAPQEGNTPKTKPSLTKRESTEMIEIDQKNVQEGWALNKGIFELTKEEFAVKLKKMPYNSKNPFFVKISIEFTNCSKEKITELSIFPCEESGDLFFCDPELYLIDLKPKQSISQNLFLKSLDNQIKKRDKEHFIRLEFNIHSTKKEIKIILPHISKLFVEFLKISDNFQEKLESKYTEELYRNRFLINHKFLNSLNDLKDFQSRLKWMNDDGKHLLGKLSCFFEKTQIKLGIVIQKNDYIENLGETLDFIIYGKNQQIVKDMQENFKIEENIIFNFFEDFIIAF